MKQPWDVIAELESDNSRLFKEAVIQRESLAAMMNCSKDSAMHTMQ